MKGPGCVKVGTASQKVAPHPEIKSIMPSLRSLSLALSLSCSLVLGSPTQQLSFLFKKALVRVTFLNGDG